MFNSKTRIGGSKDGPDFVKIDADLDTVSITITPDGTTPKAIVRFALDRIKGAVHVYVHDVEDGFEQLPRGYIRGENSLAFKLQK